MPKEAIRSQQLFRPFLKQKDRADFPEVLVLQSEVRHISHFRRPLDMEDVLILSDMVTAKDPEKTKTALPRICSKLGHEPSMNHWTAKDWLIGVPDDSRRAAVDRRFSSYLMVTQSGLEGYQDVPGPNQNIPLNMLSFHAISWNSTKIIQNTLEKYTWVIWTICTTGMHWMDGPSMIQYTGTKPSSPPPRCCLSLFGHLPGHAWLDLRLDAAVDWKLVSQSSTMKDAYVPSSGEFTGMAKD